MERGYLEERLDEHVYPQMHLVMTQRFSLIKNPLNEIETLFSIRVSKLLITVCLHARSEIHGERLVVLFVFLFSKCLGGE